MGSAVITIACVAIVVFVNGTVVMQSHHGLFKSFIDKNQVPPQKNDAEAKIDLEIATKDIKEAMDEVSNATGEIMVVESDMEKSGARNFLENVLDEKSSEVPVMLDTPKVEKDIETTEK